MLITWSYSGRMSSERYASLSYKLGYNITKRNIQYHVSRPSFVWIKYMNKSSENDYTKSSNNAYK